MTLAVTAQALLAGALLLALGFHRNRALQMLSLLLLAAIAFTDGRERLIEGALRFVPVLLVVCALLPEPRLLSRRHLSLVLIIALLGALTVLAPEHVYRSFADAAAWVVFQLPAHRGAALLTGVAAGLCLLRWTFTGRPMEFGLVLMLSAAAAGFGYASANPALGWLAGAAVIGILTVLYSSYRMAFIDPLSGLPNRRALDETLMRLSGSYSLAMVDIDHFKQFNDNYGHDAGDIVLRAVGRALRKHIGRGAFRYGGEEFCLVMEGAAHKDAPARCESAREAVQLLKISVHAPAPKRGRIEAIRRPLVGVSVTVSVGLATRASGRRNVAEVLKAADQALYRAKAKGRNRVVEA